MRDSHRVALLWVGLLAAAAFAEPPGLAMSRFLGTNTLMQRLADALEEEAGRAVDATGEVRRLPPLDLAAAPAQQPQDPTAERARPCDAEDGACLARSVPTQTGADWLLLGHVQGGREVRRIDVQLVHLPEGTVAWRNGRSLAADPWVDRVGAAVLAALERQGFRQAGPEEGEGLWPVKAPTPMAPASTPRDGAWVFTAVSSATFGGGGVLGIIAASSWAQLHTPGWRASHFAGEVLAAIDAYNGAVVAGGILAGVGLAGVVAGLVWALLTPESPPPAVTLAPAPGGLALLARWP